MHTVIWQLSGRSIPPGLQLDHRDQNGLNNLPTNLRFATISQQRMNRRGRTDTNSRFKGVSWSKQKRKWLAYIGTGKHRIHLGFFTDEHDAARAYDRAAIKHFGKFASLNTRKVG